MGTLVDVQSTAFLLQREDHADALEALKEFARDATGDFRQLDAVLAATELVTALDLGDWWTRVDEQGDIVELAYGGDKVPPDATDDFPMSMFGALKPFVRYGALVRTMENVTAVMHHTLGRGKNYYIAHEHGVYVKQLGEPPRARAGEPITIELFVSGRWGGYEGAVTIAAAHSTQVDYQFERESVAVGETARVTLTLHRGAADPMAFIASVSGPDWQDLGNAIVTVRVDTPAEEANALHEVIATESPLDSLGSNPTTVLRTSRFAEALTALHRYAIRHHDRPGAEFLRAVASAPDLDAALRAASLETGLGADGIVGFRFVGTRLPGHERYLWGLFASLRGIVEYGPWFDVAYAHDPARWVHISYEWDEPSRHFRDR